MPASGHPLDNETYNFTGSIVIAVSHSGCTFATLAVTNLLCAFTRDIFVVTSEWDTQMGKVCESQAPLLRASMGHPCLYLHCACRAAVGSSSSPTLLLIWCGVQVVRQLQSTKVKANFMQKFESFIWATECGVRPAEPASLTVVATHQVLTEVLLRTMR